MMLSRSTSPLRHVNRSAVVVCLADLCNFPDRLFATAPRCHIRAPSFKGVGADPTDQRCERCTTPHQPACCLEVLQTIVCTTEWRALFGAWHRKRNSHRHRKRMLRAIPKRCSRNEGRMRRRHFRRMTWTTRGFRTKVRQYLQRRHGETGPDLALPFQGLDHTHSKKQFWWIELTKPSKRKQKGAMTLMGAPSYANLRREFGIDDKHGDPLACSECETTVSTLETLVQTTKTLSHSRISLLRTPW